MKSKKVMFFSLAAFAFGIGAFSNVSSKKSNVTSAKSLEESIAIYVDLNWEGVSCDARIGSGDFHSMSATTKNDCKFVYIGYANENLHSVGFKFKQDGAQYHPFVSGDDENEWNTSYDEIVYEFKLGYSYKISGINWDHEYDNHEHKWFTYSVVEIGTIDNTEKPKDFYVIGSFDKGTTSWGIENAKYLNQVAEEGYSYSLRNTITLEYGDKFQIAYYNGASYEQHIGYGSLQDGGAKYCFGKSGENDIMCYASGTYLVIMHEQEGSSKTIYVAHADETRNSEQLAAKIMSYGTPEALGNGNGTDCVARYAECKEMYSNITDSSVFDHYVTSEVEQFRNAYARLSAWATANGESFANGSVSPLGRSVEQFFQGSMSDGDDSSMLLVAITSLSAASLLGIYILKKKRQY